MNTERNLILFREKKPFLYGFTRPSNEISILEVSPPFFCPKVTHKQESNPQTVFPRNMEPNDFSDLHFFGGGSFWGFIERIINFGGIQKNRPPIQNNFLRKGKTKEQSQKKQTKKGR